MVILFALITCLLALILAVGMYYSQERRYPSSPVFSHFELLKEGIDSYHRWQLHSFFYYCIFFAVLLAAINYFFFHINSWQVPVVFILGILAALLGVAAATHLSFSFERKVLGQSQYRQLFSLLFQAPVIISLSAISISFLGLILVYVWLGFPYLLDYALGSTLVTVFSLVNGGVFYKAMEISQAIITRNNDKITSDDHRNPSFWGEKVGQITVGSAGRISAFLISYLFSLIGVVMIVDHFQRVTGTDTAIASQLIKYPFLIFAFGLLAVLIGLVFPFIRIKRLVITRLLWGMYLTILMAILAVLFLNHFMPLPVLPTLSLYGHYSLFNTVMLGLLSAIVVSMVSEYYASGTHRPVKDIAEKSQFGPVNTLLAGVRQGMKSAFIPVVTLAIVIYVANRAGGVFALGLVSTGISSIMGVIISGIVYASDVFNLNSLVRQSDVSSALKSELKALDSSANTVNSVSFGFYSVVSFLSSLILLLVFGLKVQQPGLLSAEYIAILVLLGALVPYLFVYFLIKGINHTSIDAYNRSQNQLDHVPYLLDGKTTPDVVNLVKNVVKKAQLYTFTPAVLSLIVPLLVGGLLGRGGLFVFLLGSLVSCVLLAFLFSNTGGMLFNTRKYIEAGNFGGVGTRTHEAALVGDMIGSPIRDVLSPALDVFIKIMIAFSLVMIPMFG